ncbi:MarR family transcriptional regulator [Janibacter sp. Soil728]|uniref:MarR family winged helix-turn-helix transcriptional regulator n=1 Tax=Janibacter sp. Soil728 TaxID=1736393 RepID=UPI0006F2CA39|nr:MarR family transcriptional regulator [Janibacter sp. Soil728]KRE38822.1 MarR family transcriptional regulator [Janibacter sp. Soil728]
MQTTQQLDHQTCFALYSAARAATAAYREALAEIGLTYTQYVTLLALWEQDGRTVSELGTTLRLDSGTLSPLLKRMAANGLVERRREGKDGRTVTIHLTDAGHDLETQVASIQRRLYDAVDMEPEELATLRDLAQRFCASAAEITHPDTQGAPR